MTARLVKLVNVEQGVTQAHATELHNALGGEALVEHHNSVHDTTRKTACPNETLMLAILMLYNDCRH